MVENGTGPSGPLADAEVSLVDAHAVLVQAVAEATQGGNPPTASAVRLALKRLTYNGFDHRKLGFKRFRDFLQRAADAGVIEVHERPGDVVVALHGENPPVMRRTRVRRDLWKAALNWSSKEVHYLDLENDRVATLPVQPVPLEPERFALVRERLRASDESLVKIPTIDIHTQLRWMQHFVDGLDDKGLRSLLEGALAGDKPARLFAAVLRNEPNAQDLWYEALASHVLAHLQQWKESEARLAKVEVLSASGQVRVTGAEPNVFAAGGRSLVDAAGSIVEAVTALQQNPSRSRRSLASPEGQLRMLLHRAIDRMPEEELRRIRVPVGFLIED
jgi:hypothetical protein